MVFVLFCHEIVATEMNTAIPYIKALNIKIKIIGGDVLESVLFPISAKLCNEIFSIFLTQNVKFSTANYLTGLSFQF